MNPITTSAACQGGTYRLGTPRSPYSNQCARSPRSSPRSSPRGMTRVRQGDVVGTEGVKSRGNKNQSQTDKVQGSSAQNEKLRQTSKQNQKKSETRVNYERKKGCVVL